MLTQITFYEECTLVEKYKATNCEIAFGRIYSLFYDSILEYINLIVKDLEIANDLTQETFITAFQKLYTLKENRTFRMWIFTIARNKSLKHFRIQNREKNLRNSISLNQMDGEYNDLTMVEKENKIQKMEGILKGLSEEDKNLIFEKYYSEKSIQELCVASGLSQSAVKMKVHRVRKKIKESMISSTD